MPPKFGFVRNDDPRAFLDKLFGLATTKKRQTLLYSSTVRNLLYFAAQFNVADFHSLT